MAVRTFNDEAAALIWEIKNCERDIGSWKMVYCDQEFTGNGFMEFIEAAKQLVDKKQVIFVKNLNWLVEIARNFINFSDKKFFANNELNFYFIEIGDGIELRNWDNFWKKVEDPAEFLKRLEVCRTYFKASCKNRLGFETHFKFTLAKDMWEDVQYKSFLKSKKQLNFTCDLLPQSRNELEDMGSLYKGGFYYTNDKFFNRKVANVNCYDIHSSHIGLMARKRYPCQTFTQAQSADEAVDIINSHRYCWHGQFKFTKLQYKVDFPIDLSNFGFADEHEQCCWYLNLTNVDMEWFKQVFTWGDVDVLMLYYSKDNYLPVEYLQMVNDLYEDKQAQKKGTFAKEIYKFRAELPFGQPIKRVIYDTKAIYDEKTNSFDVVDDKESEETAFEILQKKLIKRGLPMYIGLWTIAYSRLEFVSVLLKIGLENVVYGDTDSVKFLGFDGIKIIEEHNKTIDAEFRKVSINRQNFQFNKELGRWGDEGIVDYFKSIGNKWYLTSKGDDIEVKAAGAQVANLENYLKNEKCPFSKFSLRIDCEKLFKEVKIQDKTVCLTYGNKIDKEKKKKIVRHGTPLYYYNPWEEKENEI